MSELVVVNPRVEDEGIYMCMAQNSEGATTALVDLYVEGTYKSHACRMCSHTQVALGQYNYCTVNEN